MEIYFYLDILVMLGECFLGLELVATHITNHFVHFGFFYFFFYHILVSVCPRLAIKLCLETFTFLMTGATH